MIVALVPAYNEQRFIGSVVLSSRKYMDLVCVVDDGSADTTGEIAGAAGAITLRHERNLGKGKALTTGFHKARELRADVIVMLHGDGRYQPVGQFRTLLFFGIPRLIIALSGLPWGGWVVDIYSRTQTLAVGYRLISVLLVILGSLSLFTGIILYSIQGLLFDLLHNKQERLQ